MRAAVLLALGCSGSAWASAPHRPAPDAQAIREAVHASAPTRERFLSARSLAHFLVASLARERGDVEAMFAELRLSALYETTSAFPRFLLASELSARGDDEQAGRELKEALQLEPSHGPSLRLAASIALRRGRAAQAVEFANRAVRSGPTDDDAAALLVEAYLAARDLDAAAQAVRGLELITRSARHDADEAVRRAARSAALVADAAASDGRDELAESLYRLAESLDPTTRRKFALAGFLETRNRFAAAETVYATVPDEDVLALAARVRAALCVHRRGDAAGAILLLEALRERHPLEADVARALAGLRSRGGR